MESNSVPFLVVKPRLGLWVSEGFLVAAGAATSLFAYLLALPFAGHVFHGVGMTTIGTAWSAVFDLAFGALLGVVLCWAESFVRGRPTWSYTLPLMCAMAYYGIDSGLDSLVVRFNPAIGHDVALLFRLSYIGLSLMVMLLLGFLAFGRKEGFWVRILFGTISGLGIWGADQALIRVVSVILLFQRNRVSSEVLVQSGGLIIWTISFALVGGAVIFAYLRVWRYGRKPLLIPRQDEVHRVETGLMLSQKDQDYYLTDSTGQFMQLIEHGDWIQVHGKEYRVILPRDWIWGDRIGFLKDLMKPY